ncbi:MAG: DUF7312 domain-containing protein [Halohasta sp.]
MSQGPPPESEPESDDDGEWRYSIDEVGPDAEPEAAEPEPIEPESVSLEHAAFVVVGVVLTLAIILTGVL